MKGQCCSVAVVPGSQPLALGKMFPECDDEMCAQGARGSPRSLHFYVGFHTESCLQDKFSPNICIT